MQLRLAAAQLNWMIRIRGKTEIPTKQKAPKNEGLETTSFVKEQRK